MQFASSSCDRSNKLRIVETDKKKIAVINTDRTCIHSQQGHPTEISDLNHVVKVKAVLVIRGQYTDISTFLSNLCRVTKFPFFSVHLNGACKSNPLSLTLHYYIQ